MGRRNESQYLQFYTEGSAARQYESKPRRPARKPRPQQEKRIRIRVDFMALTGILVAVAMLVLMAAGTRRLRSADQELEKAEAYLTELEAENAKLKQAYSAGYDPESIREKALAMGMIPASQADTVRITVEAPTEHRTERSGWNAIRLFLMELLA